MNQIDSFRGDYYFLSNMYPVRVKVNGHYYNSSEAAFQSFKFADPKDRLQFCNMDGYEAKHFWKTHKHLIRPDWNDIKLAVMEKLIHIKFFSNPNLADKLIATKHLTLIEGNSWNDNFYGDCKCSRCKTVVGENHLGKILMKVRGDLVCLN